MADSLCTFLTVDRSGPEQQEPPPRLPLPPLPLLHESQHGYADPDRPLPLVLHTDRRGLNQPESQTYNATTQ